VSDSGEIRFNSILASFNLDGRNIFLMPGSRVSAPVGDKIYRYFSASGSLGWNDSPLDLKCMGDINVRALNAFLGALQGILAVDGNPLTDPAFLQNFLSGLLGGMSVKDFRETSFNVKGTWDSPLLTDIKVTSNTPAASFSRPNGSSGKDETKIKITLEIPTGEGKDTSPSTEDQMKKQLLENIMKQIIRPGESSQE
jgi:translocation and assembly module TamB